MPLQIKKTSTVWSGPSTPFYKKVVGQALVGPNKVYTKTGVSTWTEVWPLLPGNPTSPSMNWLYRNDRIEVDLSWGAAPGSGTNATPVANANYVAYLIINGSIYGGFNLGTSTSFTLTDGDGFQDKAGQSVYFVVQAQSAAGVNGPQIASSTTTIPQLPAPPQVTSVSQAVTFGDLSYAWSHAGGNRLTGFQVNVSSAYGSATYFYGGATSVSASGHPWSGGSVNGGNYQVDIYPYGPGGYGPAYTFTGSVPNDVSFSNTRFTNQNLTAAAQPVGSATSYQMYWNLEGGSNNYYANFGGGVTNLSLPRTSIGIGDYNRARYVFVPLNAFGSGRVTATPFVRIIPALPIVDADDGDTWIGGYGGFIYGGLVEQGYDAAVGSDCYGYMFYGNKFHDQFNDSYLGYRINISSANILMGRASAGAAGPVTPVLGMQTAGDRGGATNSFAGLTYCYPSMNVGDFVQINFSPDWVRYMIDQTNGWKGLAMFIGDPSQAQNGRWYNNGTIYPTLGWPCLRVTFRHDG